MDYSILIIEYWLQIRFTNKIRTKQSAEAFTSELFGHPIDFQDSFVDENLLEVC